MAMYLSESQGHRLHREGTGAELLQEGRSLLVRLRRDGTAIYLSPRVASATVAKYLQPSPNISKHRQRDSDLAIPDRTRVGSPGECVRDLSMASIRVSRKPCEKNFTTLSFRSNRSVQPTNSAQRR